MKNLSLNILVAGLIAGTIDILAAIIILAGGNAIGTLKFVASGAFGKAALDGGNEMAAFGLLFHFIIAMCWTAAFFTLYSKLPFPKWNKWLNAIAYGLFIQILMSFVVLPLTQIPPRPFNWVSFLENAVILMFSIGLPVSLLADRFYRKSEK
jgi:hypothetical protein